MNRPFDEPRPITTFQIVVFILLGIVWAIAGLPALLANQVYSRILPASFFGWTYALAGIVLGIGFTFLAIRLYFSRKSSQRRRRRRTSSRCGSVPSQSHS